MGWGRWNKLEKVLPVTLVILMYFFSLLAMPYPPWLPDSTVFLRLFSIHAPRPPKCLLNQENVREFTMSIDSVLEDIHYTTVNGVKSCVTGGVNTLNKAFSTKFYFKGVFKRMGSFHKACKSCRVNTFLPMTQALRLMTMSPFYPCDKPCSRGTHHEKVKTQPYLLASIMIQSIKNFLQS